MEDFYKPVSSENIFPQKICIFKCPLDLKPIINQIYNIQNTHPNCIRDYPSELIYQTGDLFNSYPVFNILKNFIKELIQKNYKGRYYLEGSWANINYQYSSSKFHDHTPFNTVNSSNLSGILYLKTPPNSGQLLFHNRYNSPYTMAYDTPPSSIFIFDSLQPHSTTPNLNTSPKICISFNLKKIE